MAGLLTYNGQLQYPLSTDEDCCCGNLGCPGCCAKITSGALIGGKIRQFLTVGGNSIDVTITTTSGGRTLCLGDDIGVEFIFTGANGDPIPGTAFANFDVAWIVGGGVLGSSGRIIKRGYIKWLGGNMGVAFELGYYPCYNAEHPGLGMIQVGSESLGLLLEIEVAACPIQNCCRIEPVCEPCCFFLVGGVSAFHEGFKFYQRASELWIEAELGQVDHVKKTLCLDSGFSIIIRIGSRNPNIIENLSADVSVEFDAGYLHSRPVPPDAAPPIGDPGIVKWFNRSETEYAINLSVSCKPLRLPATTVIKVKDNTSGEVAELGIVFMACDVHEGCRCCCPDYCCHGCHFPVTMRRCEDNDFSLGPGPWLEAGGATQIVNFRTDVTSPANSFCGGTTNVMTITQPGESSHHVSCELRCDNNGSLESCTKSSCRFRVPTDHSCPGFGGEHVTIAYLQNPHVLPALPPMWSMETFYPFWDLGRTSYSGDCNGATATGSFLGPDGALFTWTTSFTVVRILPSPEPFCS